MKKILLILLLFFLIIYSPIQAMGKKVQIEENLSQNINTPYGINVGNLAFDFQLNDLEQTPILMSSFKGQKVLLVFWATWCPSCVEEVAVLNEIRQKYKENDLKILAINTAGSDSFEKVKKFTSKYNIKYTILYDAKQDVSILYKIYGIPTNILIDEQGKIIFRNYFLPRL